MKIYQKNLHSNEILELHSNINKWIINNYDHNYVYFIYENTESYSKIVTIGYSKQHTEYIKLTEDGVLRNFHYTENVLYIEYFKDINTYLLYKNKQELHRCINYLIPYNFKYNPFKGTPVNEVLDNMKIRVPLDVIRSYDGKYKKFLHKWFEEKNLKKKDNYLVYLGQFAHISSFIDIIKNAISLNYKEIIVFEYDIYIHNDFHKYISNFNLIKEEYDIVYFGSSTHYKSKITGTFALYFKSNIFEDLLELLELYILPTDEILTILHNIYKPYVYTPNIIISDISNSTIITNNRKDPSKLYEQFNWNIEHYNTNLIGHLPYKNSTTIIVELNYKTSINEYIPCIISILNQTNTNYTLIINTYNITNYNDTYNFDNIKQFITRLNDNRIRSVNIEPIKLHTQIDTYYVLYITTPVILYESLLDKYIQNTINNYSIIFSKYRISNEKYERISDLKESITLNEYINLYKYNVMFVKKDYLDVKIEEENIHIIDEELFNLKYTKNITRPANNFSINNNIKDYVITLLGYTKITENGSRHTNWYPWNRFLDVYKTLGYKCEWVEIDNLQRVGEKRIFITWNEPTSLELYKSSKIMKDDIILQKLTSLGKGMDNKNWGTNSYEWCKTHDWTIYRTFEYLYDLGLNIYGFGCKTMYKDFSEKNRICTKLKNRIFWISWGGTPFNWTQIQNAKPNMNNLEYDITFIGSKWGKVGRGNLDAWDKYITPLEKSKYKFYQFGGIGKQMISDENMIYELSKSKLCPIIHAPSWQAERGIQDRFYSVFLSGRFGITDNMGIIDIFGEELRDICTENPTEYYNKSIYYIENIDKQIKYITFIQDKIKKKYNFYNQWEYILNNINGGSNSNLDLITNNPISYISSIQNKIDNIPDYKISTCNIFFDKIFIINLKKDNLKKLNILKQLDFYKINNFEFIDAIDGTNIEYKDFFTNTELITKWEQIHKKKHINKPGELGCLLSHLHILKIAKERRYTKWLHLEDDVLFHKDFDKLFNNMLSEVPSNWDLLYLGTTQCYWRNYNKEYISENVFKANISCGTFAFAVSNKNIDFIIDQVQMLLYPIDGVLVSEIQPFLNCYVYKKYLMIAELNNSNIRSNQNITEIYQKLDWDISMYFNENILQMTNDKIKNLYNKICNNLIDKKEFENYVTGKKIAVIGPAPSCKDEMNGDYIENNYDIIIRINKQWTHSSDLDKYIGKRTDILYNCLDHRDDCGGEIDIKFLKDKVKYIVSTIKYDYSNNKTRDTQFHGKNFLNWYNYFHLHNNNQIKFIPISNKLYNYYDKLAQTRINTGLMAILHILEFDIKELYIKGFTFFLDGYLLDYRDVIDSKKCVSELDTKQYCDIYMLQKNKNHDQVKQWKLLKDIYNKKKDIIILDSVLQRILSLDIFPSTV